MGQDLDQLDTETVPSPAPMHFNLLGVVWRRKWLILLGAVAGVVWGALDYAKRPAVYRVDAQILVVKKRPDVLPSVNTDTSLSYYEDYLATHQVLIKSPLIAGRAAKKPGIAGLASLGGAADPTNLIIGALTVNREVPKEATGTAPNILDLSFRGSVPDDCSLILNAVIDGYKDFLDETYRSVNDDTLQLITKARDVLQKDLAQKSEEYRKFRQDSPLFWKGKDGVSSAQERLGSWEAKLTSLSLQRTELQARLAGIDKALAAGQSRQALAAALPLQTFNGNGDNSKRFTASSLEEQLLPLLQQEETLVEDYGPNHPQVQSIRKRIALTRKLLGRAPALRSQSDPENAGRDSAGELEDGEDVQGGDALALYIQSLKQELSDVETTQQLLTERIKGEYEDAKRLANYQAREEALREEIARSQQLYDGIIKRLQEVNIVRDYGGYYAQVITPPGAAWRVEPRPVPIISVALFLGLLGGFGLAYLAEWSDKSFRTPEEIQRHLGVPIVGYICRIAGKEGAVQAGVPGQPVLDPVLVAYHRARSPEAEAYRGIRTALYFNANGKEYKLLQVTSPSMGDGKTTTTANLAISIAQAGKRTLLIDADFRWPRLHELFGLSAPVGLATVLTGEAALEQAVQPSAVPGLSVLPCGPIPPNPAELLSSLRFQDVLGVLRDRYDVVLLDTPPLLAVSDPAVVAPRVEGLLMVLRYSKDGRPNAQRAKQILDTLGVNLLGIVVNATDRQSVGGKYSYGQHRYSYGYGYGDEDGQVNGSSHAARAIGTELPELSNGQATHSQAELANEAPEGPQEGPRQRLFDWLRGRS